MVRFVSTSIVTPESSGHDHKEFSRRIDLGPLDLQLLLADHIQKGIFLHKPTTTTSSSSLNNTNLLVQHLKAALSQTLDILRLAETENHYNTTSFSIDCNGAGALFVHAAFDGVTVADILDPIVVPDDVVYSFFSMNGVLNYEGAVSRSPLVAVQITELVDGVFVGCSMNHCVCDGTFFWHLFNTWSEISRGGGFNDGVSSPHFVFGRDYVENIVSHPSRSHTLP
ncbi:Transferase [Parasponia andersonii]|uniref:Transferase n=1 Tax=Parasponia andersonii TaxID=3476 RepID=A0A2P5B2J2_PARAD|nr:Transferase [Parasponia andersonii]